MSRAGAERMDFSGVRWRGSRKSGGNHAGMTPSPSPSLESRFLRGWEGAWAPQSHF